MDVNDVRREKIHLFNSLMQQAYFSCYDSCKENNELTYLSIKEGKCFRNCITKVGYFYPTLNFNLRDASYRTQQELSEDIRRDLGRPSPDL